MCDGSDKNQELLEKLSRQLSELTSTGRANINEISPPDIGTQWVQSSGLPSEEHPPPFSPLYTWDPAYLQASATTGSSSPHLSNSSFNTQEATAVPSSFPFPPVSHNLAGNIDGLSTEPQFSPNEFHVLGDLSGRFSNNPKSSSALQDYNPIGSSHNYHQSNTPIVGRNFGSLSPKEELFPTLSNVLGTCSLNTHHQNFDVHDPSTPSHCVTRDGVENVNNSNNLCDVKSQTPYFEPLPSFDPSTPPPPFPFQRQHSDTSGQTAGPATSTEFLDYLRLQSESAVNLDLRPADISDSWQSFPVENDTVSTSEEGKQLYSEALNKWNSFDYVGIDSPQTSQDDFTSVKTGTEESLTEPTTGQDSSKPSYSDIAKTPKWTQSSPKVELSSSDSTAKTQFLNKDGKPYRPLIQRTISASKCWPKRSSDGGIDQLKVPPTSRYGLDSFEDSIHNPTSVGKSCDSLGNLPRTKRSGSSAVALDDLPSEMIDKNIAGEDDNISVKDNKPKPNQKTKCSVTAAQSKINASSADKMPNATSQSSKSEERLFFDPKRIFQSKNTNKSATQSSSQKATGKSNVNEKSNTDETVLNNGKPTSSSFKLPTSARQHDYINNDLRDANKVTYETAAQVVHNTATAYDKTEEPHTKHKESSRSSSGKRSSGGRVNGSHHREKRKTAEDDPGNEYADAQNGHRFLPANFDREKLEEWLAFVWEKLMLWGSFLFCSLYTIARTLLICTLGIITVLSCGAYHLVRWGMILTKIYAKLGKTTDDNGGFKSRESVRRRIGLEEKIVLPSSGEEAMKRLLACKGKDPYSILGLRQDSSEDDIKKYYKRQAIMVHPDKNQEPGAEEAFKILGHAFEKIGEPGKRKEYDNQALVETESEIRKEFADLISKLQTKIQEAANLMPCDNCKQKHRRFPVDRPFYLARFCQRCNTRHAAKEGDVWAETTLLGFYWNYYALMEGQVYDITGWMKCHHEFYKRMRANEHTVLTRLVTDGNKKTKHNHNKDATLEDFINRYFPNTAGQATGVPNQTNGAQSPPGAEPGWGQASHPSTGSSSTAATRKSGNGRRKKKRH